MRRTGLNISGDRIREARLLRGLTQDELAAKVSILAGEMGLDEVTASRDRIQALECGNQRVIDSYLLVISLVLRIDPRWLISHPDGTPPVRA